MKIKTITCHDVYNYGASLQAYALQQYLISKGHSVEIIDYKPDYICRKYNFWHVYGNNKLARICISNFILRFIYCLIYAPVRYRTWQRIFAFNSFTKKHLRLTRRYKNLEELKIFPPEADCYIAGSDQIWNTNLPNGRDNAFFLDFGSENTKRISYAASFGVREIEDVERISFLLKNFDAVSVRELSGLDILSRLNVHGCQVLDPVYLLDKSQWITLMDASKVAEKESYALVYDIFRNDPRMKEFSIECSKKRNLKLVAVNDSKILPYAKNIKNAGPVEFISLIRSAKYLISNSFHATSFALIFHVPFIVLFKGSNSARMEDLLKSVGLSKCFNPSKTCVDEIEYDWDSVDDKLKKLRLLSFEFLRFAL